MFLARLGVLLETGVNVVLDVLADLKLILEIDFVLFNRVLHEETEIFEVVVLGVVVVVALIEDEDEVFD